MSVWRWHSDDQEVKATLPDSDPVDSYVATSSFHLVNGRTSPAPVSQDPALAVSSTSPPHTPQTQHTATHGLPLRPDNPPTVETGQ